MAGFFSSVFQRFESLRTALVLDRENYPDWTQRFEKKINGAILMLDALMNAADRESQSKQQIKRITEALLSLHEFLDQDAFKLDDERMLPLVQIVRRHLLELWGRLLLMIDVIKAPHDIALFINTMHKIIGRREFDPQYLLIHQTSAGVPTPHCTKDVYILFRNYRNLLIRTHVILSFQLSLYGDRSSYSSGVPHSMELYQAYARMTARLYFYYPTCGKELRDAIMAPEEATWEVINDFTHPVPIAKPTGSIAFIRRKRPKYVPPTDEKEDKEEEKPESKPDTEEVVKSETSSNDTADEEVPSDAPTSTSPDLAGSNKDIDLVVTDSSKDLDLNIGAGSDSNQEETGENTVANGENNEEAAEKTTSTDTQEEVTDNVHNESSSEETIPTTEKPDALSAKTNRRPASLEGVAVQTTADPDKSHRNSLPQSKQQEIAAQLKKDLGYFPREITKKYPLLFYWPILHHALSVFDKTEHQKAKSTWVTPFKRPGHAFFFLFMREWLTEIAIKTKAVTEDVDLESIPGWDDMVRTFLWNMRIPRHFTDALLRTCKALVVMRPHHLNFFVRCLFTRTNVYHLPAVVDALNKLSDWFSALHRVDLRIAPSFDYKFFCQGLQRIINTDHHQLVGRTVALIYNYAELFEGEVRHAIFCDFLLKECFFKLFLHWDDVVRNYYQQLLIYKMTKTRRSTLQAAIENGDSTDDIDKYDLEIHSKINVYLKIVESQLRNSDDQQFSKQLEIYAPKALAEYKNYQCRYQQW
eukprot:CAMPEP_0168516440 /NCGR_PEP_ID=MMETSP0405-20121227/5403_1 /TAXON_ID=498012 /ORGANISM="Trichosphaerium sp, Strain Am-I-7 wt" /LENGTH=754 /DNA_ID=CAMNT_0008536151 /DNA_START=33 /DNA_END=2294 /DNA_ORIENTATION=+